MRLWIWFCTAMLVAVLLISSIVAFAQERMDDGTLKYSPEQVKSMTISALLDKVGKPEPGYHDFSAMWGLSDKAKVSDPAARATIVDIIAGVLADRRKAYEQRWQLCYVLDDIGDDQGTVVLLRELQDAQSDITVFAAEGLAVLYKTYKNKQVHDALLKAAEKNSAVQEVVSRQLGEKAAPAPVVKVEELAPEGPPEPPVGPSRPVAKPLPWPFPGDYQAQSIFNNYQQATDQYIHCGLDFIHPAGTPVTAVGPGYVAAIYTNYPDWITHHFFIVTPQKGGNRGWCYTHIDPRTYAFKVGDYIKQGQALGKLVDFSVGDQPGVCHLHLHYVTFTKDPSGKVEVHSLLDPLYFFDWKDTVPPSFQPLRFLDAARRQLQADDFGRVAVSGKVDILAAITDSAYPSQAGNYGVPVVMLSISDGTHTTQKLVLDHRGDVGDEKQTQPLFLSYEEKKIYFNPDSFPRYQMIRVTKTDGDGKITSKDASQCWDTAAEDSSGNRVWPDGEYSVNVYAWDIAGNRGVIGAKVRVRN